MTEKEAIGIIQRTYNVSVPAQEDEELFEDAIEMALKALDLTQKLKELGYCHNYQHETSYLVNWIDSVNRMLLEYEKTDISGQAETGCNNAALLCNDKLSKEPGELIKVPVKLKQTVYRVNKGAEIPIIPMVVTKLQITTNNSEPVVSFCCIDEDFGETCYFEQDINQRVFLTPEAAVQKLADML